MNRRPYVRRLPSTAELHRRWLQLVNTEGPFLSVPVLKRVYPQGIDTLDAGLLSELKEAKEPFEKAWDRWSIGNSPTEEYRAARDIWVDAVLRRVFGWGDRYRTDAAPVSVTAPNGKVTVSSTGALHRNGETFALTWVIDPVRSLRDLAEDGWATDAIDRMELMLREAGVPIGLVTDGRWWALVSAPPKTTAASGIVDSQTWIEEPATRDAFAALLAPIRLAGGKPSDRLPQLFVDSVTAAEDITEALGSQVRQAIELLVQSFSESAEEAQRRGDPDPLPADGDEIYSAAVTVMMRVVFLLFAEERDLLPQGELFDSGYGLTGQLEVLRRRAEEETHEALDATSSVWHRLLATSRALFRGASFEDLRLPAYGGSLFDPTRFPFLSALTERGTLALPVNDRVMMYVLDAVQMADVKGEGKRQISFRDIDVEQIGYIYEGLLGYTCRYAPETIIGLVGRTGGEPEIPLRVLNDFADRHDTDKKIAEAILAWVKNDQPAATPPSLTALTKAITASDTVEDAELAIRAVTANPELAAELKSWIGAIRRDLRDRPMVVKQGGLLVVETPSRKNAGAHYTPRALAEEVVLHALEPLVYSPGPYQTPDRDQWRLKSPEEILDLKVADIACGSGAFLVAAARYLGARLVEAWTEAGTAIGTPKEQETDAIREVVAHCLYGADINPMAIEMCKLSLWLVSLDPRLPFSFVDDKMLVGNSLLGITDLAQLEALHIDPSRVPAQPLFDVTSAGFGSTVDVRGTIAKAIRIRQALATEVDNDDPQRSAAAKQGQLRRLHETTAQLRDIADGVIAAGLRLGGKPGRALDEAFANLRIAVNDAYPTDGEPDRTMLDDILRAALIPTVQTDYERWQPLHWPVELPDVFERGGFDAIVGNPPFLGGPKLTGALGTNVRDWLVYELAGGARGISDLVAYFFLRAWALLNPRATLGLIATSTVAQGDTREVGLEQMVADGFIITRSIQSRSWPAAGANLEFAAVWGAAGSVSSGVMRSADGALVPRISTMLEPQGRVDGAPTRLSENMGSAFIGCYVLGMGFVITPEEAKQWITEDPRNSDVLVPYLNGDDLNSRPEPRASRWVIDFNALSESSAAAYEAPFKRLLATAKLERSTNNRKVYRDYWWQFAEKRPALRRALAGLEEMLVITRHSVAVMPLRVPTAQLASEATVVIACSSYAQQAILSSGIHQMWAVSRGSTLGHNTTRYTPSSVYETFPRPAETVELEAIGRLLDSERRETMLRRDLGLTKLYNLVNDPDLRASSDSDIARLRGIHVELNEAVMAAYGWSDVVLNHGFHAYRQMTRWTVCPEARVEILDRLLEENHRRAALQGEVVPAVSDDEEVEE